MMWRKGNLCALLVEVWTDEENTTEVPQKSKNRTFKLYQGWIDAELLKIWKGTDLALESQLGLNLYKRISVSDYEGK